MKIPQKQPGAANRLADGTRRNAEGLGYIVAVSLPWLLNDVIGYPVPAEVQSALIAGVISIAVRVREWM